MDGIISFLREITGIESYILTRILQTLFTIFIIFILRMIIMRIMRKHIEDPKTLYNWRNVTAYVSSALAILLVSIIWIDQFATLATFFGLVGAGLVVALREPIVNMAAWTYLIFRQPFIVGDRIQIGNTSGDVVDKGILHFTLMEIGNWVDADQSTGRLVVVPNGRVFVEPVANYTGEFPFIWNEIPVLITYESNWKKAKEILLEIITEFNQNIEKKAVKSIYKASKKLPLYYTTLSPIIYTSKKDHGIMLTIRYLCEARGRRGGEHILWEKIFTSFTEVNDIRFAYPTQRIYHNVKEANETGVFNKSDIVP